MNPRLVNTLFGLVAVIGVAIGVYSWASISPTPIVTATPMATLTPSPQPSSTINPVPSVSLAPQVSKPVLSENLSLAVANQIETVEAGGSLTTLAAKYNVTVSQLVKVNSLKNADQVYAGQQLIIPDDVSQTDYTILFTLNENRLKKEKTKVSSGARSVYDDPITAFQADAKGLFGITTDAPFSNLMSEDGKNTTLSSSIDIWLISASLEKQADGFWIIKRIIAKLKPTPSATPYP